MGQFPGDQTPKWDRETTYLDGILQIPAGPGTAELHGFMTLGRRWNDYYRGPTFVSDKSDDKTQGIIAEYQDVDLFDHHRFTFGAEYQTLGTFDDETYVVWSGYVQDVYRPTERWTLTPGVRYYHVDMNTYYSQFGAGWPTEGKDQTDEGFYPSLKADFQYSPETALYAAVSRSYRLPCP